jgi:hypothetical protein
MDMSPAYWSAVLEHLPEAAIVFDRFHLTKPRLREDARASGRCGVCSEQKYEPDHKR